MKIPPEKEREIAQADAEFIWSLFRNSVRYWGYRTTRDSSAPRSFNPTLPLVPLVLQNEDELSDSSFSDEGSSEKSSSSDSYLNGSSDDPMWYLDSDSDSEYYPYSRRDKYGIVPESTFISNDDHPFIFYASALEHARTIPAFWENDS